MKNRITKNLFGPDADVSLSEIIGSVAEAVIVGVILMVGVMFYIHTLP